MSFSRQISLTHSVALALLLLCFASISQAATSSQGFTPSERNYARSFSEIGAGGYDLIGLNNNAYLNVGVRADEVVQSATLELSLAYSPALLEGLSHIKVYLNNEVVGIVPLPKQASPEPTVSRLSIDPRYFSDFNQLRLSLIGHYTLGCEDPAHSSLWANISKDSRLLLNVAPITLPNDLALLPAPFFDRHDNQQLDLPFVFSAQPDTESLAAASIAASWFGKSADYRSIRFPASLNSLPSGHAVVFAKNGDRIKGLQLPEVSGPTIDIIGAYQQPAVKYLVIRGRDANDLRLAAQALALGNVLMSGSQARIRSVDLGKPRLANDAPNWVRTTSPIRFAELIKEPYELQRSYANRDPIRLNLRLPPDLFTWRVRGIDMDLRYRYTPPTRRDNSLLGVYLNNQFVTAYPLLPGKQMDAQKLSMPVLDEDSIQAQKILSAPPFYVGVRNELQLRYQPEVSKDNLCSAQISDSLVAAIDPDSTIDFSRYPHYIAMPSLSAFAQAGFPFTRYADLAQTAVVLVDKPSAGDITAMLNSIGRFSAATGFPGVRVSVATVSTVAQVKNKDLLIVGSTAASLLRKQWRPDTPAYLTRVLRVLRSSTVQTDAQSGWLTAQGDPVARRDITIMLTANGAHSALTSYQAPMSPGRTVVALQATDDKSLQHLFDAMDRNELAERMQGDVVLVNGEQVDSFRTQEIYHVGHLPIMTRLWLVFSDQPIVLAVASVALGLFVAMLMFFGLNYVAKRRLVK
ncbi:MAG: cellulose biosynthesis cyclic di-GMP-binding regulatory protein BcsB [Paraperlucidibaca sp.]